METVIVRTAVVYRFGGFELDAGSGELRLHGDVLKLQRQPLRVLELLLRQNGAVVTRDEIRQHIWSGDTFVDFEQGLNYCIRQIREALGDAAGTPRFVETLPRRGYRFLMPVQTAAPAAAVQPTRLIVLPFRWLRPDPELDFLAFSLPDAVTTSLSALGSIIVRSSLTAARFGGDAVDSKRVAAEADVDVIVTGALLHAGAEVRVTTQMTDAATGTLLGSEAAQAPASDVFHLQDELTRRIVASLSLPLTTREDQLLHCDVPATSKAYEYFLRGNQLSHDAKQWAVARDLYQKCVADDPHYAPAWARLGRIHHVMGKYLGPGAGDGLARADEALRRALVLNPDLTLAHKLYAQLEVDLGRAREAMTRLLGRATVPDSEVFAGLVSACRYCGLLDASAAAHRRAVELEPRIRTSVMHTWFLQRDFAAVATGKLAEFPFIVPLALDALGRKHEVLPALRDLEAALQTRLREFAMAARALLEGRTAESIAAAARIADSEFRDPEGLFYLARLLAHLDENTRALAILERVVAGGFVCFPALSTDPWLGRLRRKPAFTKLLRQAEAQHQLASADFASLGGARILRT